MRPRVLEPRDAHIAHRDPQLVLQDLNQVLHALLPVPGRVQETAPDAHARGAQAQTLEDVRAAPDPAVDVDLEPSPRPSAPPPAAVAVAARIPLRGREDLGKAPVALEQDEDGGRAGVEVAAAVVAEHDAVEAVLERQLDVVGRHDALEEQRQRGLAPQPRNVVPAQARVDEVAHDAAETAALLVVLGLVVDHRARERLVGAHALVRFALPGRRGVDRHVDRADVLGVGVEFAEQGLGLVALAVDVELEEEGVRGRGGGDVEGGVGGVGADALDDAAGGAGARHGELAVGVDEAGHGGGGNLEIGVSEVDANGNPGWGKNVPSGATQLDGPVCCFEWRRVTRCA